MNQKNIRPITMDELDKLGIDDDNNLYWDKSRLQTVIKFSFWEKFMAIVVSLSTLGSFIVALLEYLKG